MLSQENSVLNLEIHHLSCNLVAQGMLSGAEDSGFKQGRKERLKKHHVHGQVCKKMSGNLEMEAGGRGNVAIGP